MKRFLLTVGIAAITSIITVFAFRIFDKKNNEINTYFNNQVPVQRASLQSFLPDNGPNFTVAAEKTVHAVVHIKTQYNYKNSYYDQFFGYDPFFNFFNQRPYGNSVLMASGSGVLISENGYIVTNNHVVSDATQIEVTLNDKRTYTATIVGSDRGTDLALIKIDDTNLPYITYGNSDDAKIGEWVLAVGNPFNLTSTVTAGIVSAKARDINILGDNTSVESFIQTDAAVNPGNSGGALVNINGELIGINAAIATNTGSFAGYSFAIPSNIVRKVIADILEFGEVKRAFMGINFSDIDSKLAKSLSLKNLNGVYVVSVYEDGASFKAGIKQGDIIIKFNDKPVNSQSELKEMLIRQRPGDKVNLIIMRDGTEKSFSVTLENREGTTEVTAPGSTTGKMLLGASFSEISQNEKSKLGLEYGVKITKLEKGKLYSAGIKENFIITSIDNKPVKSVSDIDKYLGNKQGGTLIEGIYINGMQAYYAFGM
ncbi:MAG: Do family serine endopeptidase [Bacteroidota bacterium]